MFHDEPWQIVVAMAGLSVGVGFAFAAMAALITEAVEPTETGIATGINTVMRTVGAVVGAQVGAAILTATTLERDGVPTEGAYVTAFVAGGGRSGVRHRDRRVRHAAAPPARALRRSPWRLGAHDDPRRSWSRALWRVSWRHWCVNGDATSDPEPGSLSTFQVV